MHAQLHLLKLFVDGIVAIDPHHGVVANGLLDQAQAGLRCLLVDQFLVLCFLLVVQIVHERRIQHGRQLGVVADLDLGKVLLGFLFDAIHGIKDAAVVHQADVVTLVNVDLLHAIELVRLAEDIGVLGVLVGRDAEDFVERVGLHVVGGLAGGRGRQDLVAGDVVEQLLDGGAFA